MKKETKKGTNDETRVIKIVEQTSEERHKELRTSR